MKLNIGCGDRVIPGWTNVDQRGFEGVEICDIRKLSEMYNDAEIIYASHILEYFDEREVSDILKDWYSVLVPGGILRLAVPNLEALIVVYRETKSIANIVGPLFGRMVANKKLIYHRMVYDYSTLAFLLRTVGFRAIRKWDWRKVDHQVDDGSRAYFPHMDKLNGLLLSLNVEGTK